MKKVLAWAMSVENRQTHSYEYVFHMVYNILMYIHVYANIFIYLRFYNLRSYVNRYNNIHMLIIVHVHKSVKLCTYLHIFE